MSLPNAHEVTQQLGDLARMTESFAAAVPSEQDALDGVGVPRLADAIRGFEAAWGAAGVDAVELVELGQRIAAAGMAYLEGDARTAALLVGTARQAA